MARSSKDAWIGPNAGDLKEAEVEDVPTKGESVKIRALSATAANGATSDAITTYEDRGMQKMKVDSVMLDILRFQAGVIEPKFSVDEVKVISGKFGPAFNRVVSEIAKLSGLTNEAVAETEARFPGSGSGTPETNGSDSPSGDGRPAVPERVGARAGNDD